MLLLPWRTVAAESLFDAPDPLAVGLELPLQELLGKHAEDRTFQATLRYVDAGGAAHSAGVKLRARGKTRKELCDMPPLRLDFKRKEVAGTLFDGQNHLKMVVQCKGSQRHRDYLLMEQKIYRLINLLTEQSFRTRLLTVTYRDSAGKAKPFTEPAFLIEDVGEAGARLGLRHLKQPRVDPAQGDPAAINLVEVFQYLIGNTDWSIMQPSLGEGDCCHNGKPFAPHGASDGIVILPYDFDSAGLIDTDYAAPSPMLKISSVRTRVYRGLCSHNAHIPASLARIVARRADIERLFVDAQLSNQARGRAQRYLTSFFEMAADPAAVKKALYGACLGAG